MVRTSIRFNCGKNAGISFLSFSLPLVSTSFAILKCIQGKRILVSSVLK